MGRKKEGRRGGAGEGRYPCGDNAPTESGAVPPFLGEGMLKGRENQPMSCSRIVCRIRFSRRETCTCVIPRRRATSVWVLPR